MLGVGAGLHGMEIAGTIRNEVHIDGPLDVPTAEAIAMREHTPVA